MNRLTAALAKNRAAGRAGVIPYFTAGFPTLEASRRIVLAAAEAGATAIEIGAPFSDPIADGPTIQHSSQAALAAGVTFDGILRLVGDLRTQIDTPLVLMGYANTFLRRGFGATARELAAAGADGIIVPDLPPEEADELIAAAREVELATIFLVAQTTGPERARAICAASTGFVYYVARLGVTGEGTGLAAGLAGRLAALKETAGLPVAAGFGISTPEEVRVVTEHADAAIIGSALVRSIIEAEAQGRDAAEDVGRQVRGYVAAARGA
jgi:tryptophan synthase alpha chain